jgi:UDP-N-acetylmuramoylalanine--D-glutamate ligase
MTRPVVLIAGGDGKGQNFSPLAETVKARARAVVLIGRDRDRIADALAETQVPTVRAENMNDAVTSAYSRARPGDAVLLSPACASFDMFRDYRHRGEVFASAVMALKPNHNTATA